MKGAKSFPDFRCPSSKSELCVLAEAGQNQIVFTFFDPLRGRIGEAARINASPSKFFWDLSGDGSQLAYGEFKTAAADHLTVASLKEHTTRDIPVMGRTALSSVAWSTDNHALFVATTRREGSDLLRVALDGKIDTLQEQTGKWFASLQPSPDGRSLAFSVRTTDSNVWLLETK